jgi:ankyrin repeat protein
VWRKIKKLFGGGESPPRQDRTNASKRAGGQPPGDDETEVGWLADAENPYGVPIIDLRSFALAMVSVSQDKQMAENAMSYGSDDGTAFLEQQPPSSRVVDCALRFRIDRVLLEGALFQPAAMEDKWALYFRAGRVLCIRSWQRRVIVSAHVRTEGDLAVVGPVTGMFVDGESPEMTVRELEFVLRSHALQERIPAPLAFEPTDLQSTAVAMFSLWGPRALLATHHALAPSCSLQPLRTESLVHIAVARGDRAKVEQYIAQGLPMDVLARDGLGLPHWALNSSDHGMLAWLLDRGCPVDVCSTERATPLMNAVQARSIELVRLLVDRGADVNARDARGFTSLHRAAEMGELEIVRFLLEHGANASVSAQGKTPLALAEIRNQAGVMALLKASASS